MVKRLASLPGLRRDPGALFHGVRRMENHPLPFAQAAFDFRKDAIAVPNLDRDGLRPTALVQKRHPRIPAAEQRAGRNLQNSRAGPGDDPRLHPIAVPEPPFGEIGKIESKKFPVPPAQCVGVQLSTRLSPCCKRHTYPA